VYDMQGRDVQTLVNDRLNAGTYEVSFYGSSLNSGVYFYKMGDGRFYRVKEDADDQVVITPRRTRRIRSFSLFR